MKYAAPSLGRGSRRVAPLAGGVDCNWDFRNITANDCASPPSRGAWIEILIFPSSPRPRQSPPSRGAWIEIGRPLWAAPGRSVAPLAGGVD